MFADGDCKKGPSCNFAHGEKELRGLPNFKKTRLCIPFKTGQCSKKAEECKYAHGESELRKVTNTFIREDFSERREDRRREHNDRHRRDNRDRREIYRLAYLQFKGP